jgi:uncharacterized membrane protein
MNNKKGISWLYNELPELINKGIISPEISDNIKSHYGKEENNNWKQVILTIFGVLGAVFIGLGLILLIGNNWDELSRQSRTVISLAPMIIAQSIAGFTIWKKYESPAWLEGSAIFLMAAIGSSIALIGQTYHLSGDLESFLFTWMLLSIPIVYIMKVSLVAFFYLIGITSWVGYAGFSGGNASLFWPLLALLIPEFWSALKENAYSNRSIFLSWALAICLCIGLGFTLERTNPGQWLIIFSSFFASLYLVGNLWFSQTSSFWQKPFQTIGACGLLALSFALTYYDLWKDISSKSNNEDYNSYGQHLISVDLISVIFPLIAISLIIYFARKGKTYNVLFSSLSVLTIISYFLSGTESQYIQLNTVLFNIFIFSLGLITMVGGINRRHMGAVNGGMLIIAFLIFLRFFDMEIEFVVRGIIFILIGLAFFVTNFLMVREPKAGKE